MSQVRIGGNTPNYNNYDPFDFKEPTTTIPPEVIKAHNEPKPDSEYYEDKDVGIPQPGVMDNDHPVSESKNDIDPRHHAGNTVPYQNITRIIDLIERTGIPTVWERSFPCPCFNPKTEQPRSDCPLCHGRGLLYKTPKILQVAYQSNTKGPYNGSMGVEDMGTTTATPQLTENGIENGISFRDRLTIPGLTIGQTFMFNVTSFRQKNGIFIPYLINKFDDVYTLVDNALVSLDEGELPLKDNQYYFDSKSNKMYISNNLIDHNITMNLTSPLRYYVVDISKETRYAQVKDSQEKDVYFNYEDPNLKNYMEKFGTAKMNGTIYVRLPKKLVLRREDMYIPKADFSDPNSNADGTVPIDPKETLNDSQNISDFMGN